MPRSIRTALADETSAVRLLTDILDSTSSLNEILGELLAGVRDGATPDPEWLETAISTLREQNWKLGYEFHGMRPDLEWLEKEAERRSGTPD